MTHTPGPWRAYFRVTNQRNQTGHWYFVGTNGTHEPVVNLNSKFAQAEADARLIAAAPALLEALEAIVNYYNEDEILAKDLNKASAAIALAKGESK